MIIQINNFLQLTYKDKPHQNKLLKVFQHILKDNNY